MGGFIERQSEDYSATPGNSSFVIKAYSQEHTQTLVTLAQNFAFFDTYHAEHPGPTNPNRQFATGGSTCGFVDDSTQSAGWWANNTGVSCVSSIFEVRSSLIYLDPSPYKRNRGIPLSFNMATADDVKVFVQERYQLEELLRDRYH